MKICKRMVSLVLAIALVLSFVPVRAEAASSVSVNSNSGGFKMTITKLTADGTEISYFNGYNFMLFVTNNSSVNNPGRYTFSYYGKLQNGNDQNQFVNYATSTYTGSFTWTDCTKALSVSQTHEKDSQVGLRPGGTAIIGHYTWSATFTRDAYASHDLQTITIKEPTCTTAGEQKVICSRCAYVQSTTVLQPVSTAHAYTYTSLGNGKHTAVCSLNAAHNISEENCSGGTATCGARAICQKCNTAYGSTPPHTWTDWTYNAEEYFSIGHYRTCTVCNPDGGYSLTGYESELYHSYTGASCVQKGKCKCGKEDQYGSHSYTYTQVGDAIRQVCAHSSAHNADISLVQDSAVSTVYTGNPINALKAQITGYQLVLPTINYDDNVNVGTVTGSLTLGGVTIEKTFEITPATMTAEQQVTNYESTYDGQPHGLDISNLPAGSTVYYKTSEEGEYTTEAVTRTNAGTTTVWYKVTNPNYNEVTGTATITINKAEPEVTITPAEHLTYNYEPQPLVAAATVTGGALEYRLEEDGQWSAQIPTGTDAGRYTIYWRVHGDENHNDIESTWGRIVVAEINKKFLTNPNFEGLQAQYLYTGQPIEPTFVLKDGDNVIPADQYDVQYGNNKEVGTAAIYIQPALEGNYDVSSSANFQIVKHIHSWTFRAEGDTIIAACNGQGEACDAENTSITIVAEGKSYDGDPVVATLSGSVDGVANPAIVYCCEGGCKNAGSHTASITLGDATAVAKFEITKADPAIGTVTAGDLRNTADISAIKLTRENTAIPGTLVVDAGQTLTLGENEVTYTFTPTDNTNYKTVTGKVTVTVEDTEAPTGSASIGTNTWSSFQREINFGLFFKETQTVAVTAEDSVDRDVMVKYYVSGEALSLTAVQNLAADQWTEAEDGSITVTAEDEKQFVCYICLTDDAGNVTYLSTDGGVFDTTAPVIEGVEDGDTCYTRQSVTVEDDNLDTVTVNGDDTAGDISLEGNKEAVYTIVATDKAGNTTTVTVTMAPIADLADPMEGKTEDNVTSADEDALQNIVDTADALLEDADTTDAEKEELSQAKTDAEALLDAIDGAQAAIDTEDIQKVEDVTAGNVTPENKTDLQNAKADLEAALEEYSDNYTADEKTAINADIQRIENALAALEKVADVEELIEALPKTVEPDDDETVAEIEDVKEAYDKLTEHEKSLVEEEARKKLDALTAAAVDYKIVKGDGGVWTKNVTGSISFTANGSFEKFEGIKIDGKKVADTNYEAKSGSTIITMKQSYMNKLSTGKHTITVLYTDGEASGTFHVTAKSTGPATGDGFNIVLYGSVFAVSLAALTVLLLASRKRKQANG